MDVGTLQGRFKRPFFVINTMKSVYLLIFPYLFLFAVMPCKAETGEFEKAQQQHSKTINLGIRSQQKIELVDDEIQSLQEKIKTHQRQLETLQKYNQRMEKLITHQSQELARLDLETKRVTHLDREMLPLVESMLNNLETFIASDLPFLPKERRERLASLKAMLDRADISVAEKFRRMLEAYQIESEFGRTLEVYQGQLAETDRVVDFLRIGRNMLFYKSQNNEEIARWDSKQKTWLSMDKKYHREIKKAYLIAKNQRAPELLLLPMPKAEQLLGEKQ
jgi:chromosome segregation ATPase